MEDKAIRAIKEVAMDSFEDKCADLINNGYSIIAIDVLIAPIGNNTIWTAVFQKIPPCREPTDNAQSFRELFGTV